MPPPYTPILLHTTKDGKAHDLNCIGPSAKQNNKYYDHGTNACTPCPAGTSIKMTNNVKGHEELCTMDDYENLKICKYPNVEYPDGSCKPCAHMHFNDKEEEVGTTTDGTNGDCKNICENCDVVTPSFCSQHKNYDIKTINTCCKGKFPFITKPRPPGGVRDDKNKNEYQLDDECYVNVEKLETDELKSMFYLTYLSDLSNNDLNIYEEHILGSNDYDKDNREMCERGFNINNGFSRAYKWTRDPKKYDVNKGRCQHYKYREDGFFVREMDVIKLKASYYKHWLGMDIEDSEDRCQPASENKYSSRYTTGGFAVSDKGCMSVKEHEKLRDAFYTSESCEKPNVLHPDGSCKPCASMYFTEISGGKTTDGKDGDCKKICDHCEKISELFCLEQNYNFDIHKVNECCPGKKFCGMVPEKLDPIIHYVVSINPYRTEQFNYVDRIEATTM